MKQTSITPEFVEIIPDKLVDGVLYISEKYGTALHKCCCGCGQEVVTPLKPSGWKVMREGGKVSLAPSIGNWTFPCRSHYWIRRNQIVWAGAFSDQMIKRVQARDRSDIELHIARVNAQKAEAQGHVRQPTAQDPDDRGFTWGDLIVACIAKVKAWWRGRR